MANEIDRKLRLLRAKQKKLFKAVQQLTRDAGSGSPHPYTPEEVLWYVSWALYENQIIRDLLHDLAALLKEDDEQEGDPPNEEDRRGGHA